MPRFAQLLLPCALLCGCVGPGEGLEVPKDQIYFPTGLALDSTGDHLFVVSSDFDLQYNGGALQSYRLGDVTEPEEGSLGHQLPLPCSSDDECRAGVCVDGLCECPTGDRAREQQLLYPGRCAPIDPVPLQVNNVKAGAFATDIVVRPNPDLERGEHDRLFVPVRGDSTLHWLDVFGDGKLECGQSANEGACDSAHRAGQNAARENTRDLNLSAEPFAIDANETGRTIVVTNQTTGTASLFVNDWTSDGPFLRFALSSDRIPSRPVGIAALPRTPQDESAMTPTELSATPDAFLMTFRNSAQVRLVRFADDGISNPEREYLVDAGGVAIDANSVGSDSRGVAIDASEREAAVARCGDDQVCKNEAGLTPIDVYVANRAPASLLIGRTRPPAEYPYFFDSLPLTVGPSRVVVGKVRTPQGALETRVFVGCFDSRRVFVYDPLRSRFEAEIQTGRGPHALAVDTQRSRLYVGHFTDSFVGVFSLDLGHPETYGTMLGTLGTPKPPRSSK